MKRIMHIKKNDQLYLFIFLFFHIAKLTILKYFNNSNECVKFIIECIKY